jgi:predicted amidohydrolase
MIVSPWGEILAESGEEPGIVSAEIDTAQITVARQRIPALNHARNFDVMFADEGQPVDRVNKELS